VLHRSRLNRLQRAPARQFALPWKEEATRIAILLLFFIPEVTTPFGSASGKTARTNRVFCRFERRGSHAISAKGSIGYQESFGNHPIMG